MTIKKIQISAILISCSLLLTNHSQTYAASSPCKAQNQSSCSAKTNQCSWVKEYKRKNGSKVKAHCKTKATKATSNKKKVKSNKQLNTNKPAKSS